MTDNDIVDRPAPRVNWVAVNSLRRAFGNPRLPISRASVMIVTDL